MQAQEFKITAETFLSLLDDIDEEIIVGCNITDLVDFCSAVVDTPEEVVNQFLLLVSSNSIYD